MDLRVPNRRLTQRIVEAVRDGVSLECACRGLGIDPVTLQAWMSLGLKVEPQERQDDPFGRFVNELQRAMEGAQSSHDADAVANEPQRQPERSVTQQPLDAPNDTPWDWENDDRPLAWQVVSVAPIEFHFGPTTVRSQPAWHEPSAGPSEAGSMPVGDSIDSDAEAREEVDAEPCVGHRDVPIEMIVAIRIVGVAALIAVILLVIALTLIATVIFVAVGLVRGMLALAYRWRAGVIALRGGGADGCPWPDARARQSSMSALTRFHPSLERSLGPVALAGRNRPQRE